MKFRIEEWTVRRLIEEYTNDHIVLNPPYQRNAIWSLKAQQSLINTVARGWPIPNFFLLHRNDGRYEMVDGQQRARTLIGFDRGMFSDENGRALGPEETLDKEQQKYRRELGEYRLIIIILSDLKTEENVEEFYALVNSSGLRLNRPELKKAEYFNTNFLRLMTYCAESKRFHSLSLFPPSSIRRMEHVDFVGELLALLKFGITDKKARVDDLFDADLQEHELEELRETFRNVTERFIRLNQIVPLCRTRYRQKNDFYSLFSFVASHPEIDNESLEYYYNVLLKLSSHIKPSQEKCDTLKEYAYHCVTQSNSKAARDRRLALIEEWLLNPASTPNGAQKQILAYFGRGDGALLEKSQRWTFTMDDLVDQRCPELGL